MSVSQPRSPPSTTEAVWSLNRGENGSTSPKPRIPDTGTFSPLDDWINTDHRHERLAVSILSSLGKQATIAVKNDGYHKKDVKKDVKGGGGVPE